MRVWTNASFRAFDLLSGPAPAGEEAADFNVNEILHRAALEGAPVAVSRLDPSARRLPIEAVAEHYDGATLQVGHPSYRPGQKGLMAGERIELRINLAEGSYTGETVVFARFAPDDRPARSSSFGISRPKVLVLDDRRCHDRIGIASDLAPRVELLCTPRHSLLARGSVVDLSSGGLRVRGVDELRVRNGDRVVVRTRLDEDTVVHAMGIVVHAAQQSDGTNDIGVRFQADQPDVDRYIRTLAASTATRRLG